MIDMEAIKARRDSCYEASLDGMTVTSAGPWLQDIDALLAECERLSDLLESHGPEDHNVTNEQHVALRTAKLRFGQALEEISAYGTILTGDDAREMHQIARLALASIAPPVVPVPCHHGVGCDGKGLNCGPLEIVSEEESKR